MYCTPVKGGAQSVTVAKLERWTRLDHGECRFSTNRLGHAGFHILWALPSKLRVEYKCLQYKNFYLILFEEHFFLFRLCPKHLYSYSWQPFHKTVVCPESNVPGINITPTHAYKCKIKNTWSECLENQALHRGFQTTIIKLEEKWV